MEIGEGYLDEKFAELRKAQIAVAAATIYVGLLAAAAPVPPDQALDRLEGLKAQAAKDAVDLYFRV